MITLPGSSVSRQSIAADSAPGVHPPKIQRICVFCGSRRGANPAFTTAGALLGTLIGNAGLGLIYGGGVSGLMGTIATAAVEAGGHVTAVVPRFLMEREQMHERVHELIVVEDMHARKSAMCERADAFVAMPGGIGTLEELVEQMTWLQLGRHRKPLVLVDIAAFWQPLLSLLYHMESSGFLSHDDFAPLICSNIESVLPLLGALTTPTLRQSVPLSSSAHGKRVDRQVRTELVEVGAQTSRHDVYVCGASALDR
jgi:uncharacterized protein (TIGR00730 family)